MNRLRAVVSAQMVQGVLIAMLALWAWPASANGLSPRDQKQVIEVVQAQLAALARDDAVKAFSYASPNIQKQLGSAQNFMAMVRTRYQAVYRPTTTTFMQPSGDASAAELQVHMVDAQGNSWIATYVLERQRNKTWRIAGCAIAEATGTMV
jgi:hypothetical protein